MRKGYETTDACEPGRRRGSAERGFTLVELMVVVLIIGVLAALGLYGVRKYLANAKTAEVRTALGRIARDAQTAFAREALKQDVLDLTEHSTIQRFLCGNAPLVPAALGSISGKKYQSSPSDWRAGGWECLKFTMTDPQYFMYGYVSSATAGEAGDTFTAMANGDLDGDLVPSTFQLFGAVQGGAGDLQVTLADQIRETDPLE